MMSAVSSIAAKRALPESNICSLSCLTQAGATTSDAAHTSKDHGDYRLQLPPRAILRGQDIVAVIAFALEREGPRALPTSETIERLKRSRLQLRHSGLSEPR